ncbi:N5-glutamine methyltransferase family protein [Parabacteroides distasonis]|uniref:Release factor glutamine methyltransferase n=1 Tax=Parabacteroides distasonis TaxID=823 RepID=A0A3L7ZSS5_PARDI|nr:HemK/PrmC family methyltransferase [Parabacteroides distasonis]NBH89358.1 peptide chain release factor N(5)-glutamine methyltransferase [Parabacteroides distasonis]RLT74809.1 peptide chain release factor N(5)-glutamine methyltransferase [Parabacteroides distasonis]TGY54831.1 peptide chain release factor N(5)-glutamine methyltransferase [Parabacteroides distasonis]
MTETVAYIRNSLKDIYPPGETQALVRLIMERVCGLSTYQLLLGKDKELSDTEKFKIKEIVEGLRLYKPIQYLLGIADFYGMEFKVTPDVLIPRPETAELVERIITDYRSQAPRILDIGTGSGCIAISLAKHLPRAEVAAVDISPEALTVAEENARLNQVSVSFLELDILSEGNPSFMQGKLKFHVEETKVSHKENKSFTYMKPKSHTEETTASFIGNFNCIVSNPPYIMDKEKATMEANVLENEPHMALFVPDDDPLLFYRAIARFGQRHLMEGGHLYFEINALCGKETVAMLRQENYTEVELIQDLYGKDRIVKAKI